MHSCWLSLFDQNAASLVHVVTETVYSGRRHHLTEKTFKPICLRMPFVIVGPRGSLDYLKSYGFRTFSDLWSEDYDAMDDDARIPAVADLLSHFDQCSHKELAQYHKHARAVVEHNYQHFYSGGFERCLWQELCHMLERLRV